MKTKEYQEKVIYHLSKNSSVRNLLVSEYQNHTFVNYECVISKLSKDNQDFKFCLLVFKKNKKSPIANYHYSFLDERNEAIKRIKDNILNNIESYRKYYEVRQAENDSIKKDSVLYCSWGYEQTNIDFYIVLERKGQSLTLQQIGQNIKLHSYQDRGKCIADPTIKIGEPFKKRLSKYGGVKLNSYSYAKVYNGQEVYFSTYA